MSAYCCNAGISYVVLLVLIAKILGFLRGPARDSQLNGTFNLLASSPHPLLEATTYVKISTGNNVFDI